jgi:hypothetical protein
MRVARIAVDTGGNHTAAIYGLNRAGFAGGVLV